MKNKRYLILIFLLATIGIVMLAIFPRAGSKSDAANSNETIDVASENSLEQTNSLNREATTSQPAPAQGESSFKNNDIIQSVIGQMESDYLARNVRPVFFYGLVVDEKQQPVVGADVTFSKTQTGNPAPRKTDSSGSFELSNVTGRYLSVQVGKAGYYPTKTSQQSFDYSPEGGNFQGNVSNPVVFELRKKGSGTDLITSQYGVKSYLAVSAPRDGTVVRVDFFNRKVSPDGQMELSQIKPAYENWKQATYWSYRLAIPDGGFVETTDQFQFEAPVSGYQQAVEFKFQKSDTNWIDHIEKTFYIKFGNPVRYGRIHVETSIDTGTILEYAINPDGSRNLEPK